MNKERVIFIAGLIIANRAALLNSKVKHTDREVRRLCRKSGVTTKEYDYVINFTIKDLLS